MRITVLAGGIGAARFLRGLLAAAPEATITVIGNTADDITLFGLRVCPDLDSVMYTLGGGGNDEQGWGRAGESFRIKDELAAYGAGPSWFTLGDLDFATHILRSQLLAEGRPLSEATRILCDRWQPGIRLLPMSDDRVETQVKIDSGMIHFQEWWVRLHAAVPAEAIIPAGADVAAPAPGVLEAIAEAELVVVCPSNPVTSIGPILAVPGIAEALAAARAPVVGVSPIVVGGAVSGPAAALMRARGWPVSTVGVARAYAPWLRRLLIDPRDAGDGGELARLGVTAVPCDIMMPDRAREVALARAVLELA